MNHKKIITLLSLIMLLTGSAAVATTITPTQTVQAKGFKRTSFP